MGAELSSFCSTPHPHRPTGSSAPAEVQESQPNLISSAEALDHILSTHIPLTHVTRPPQAPLPHPKPNGGVAIKVETREAFKGALGDGNPGMYPSCFSC